MIREYKTVEEISGPLMMVRMVENVTYDELVEIEVDYTYKYMAVIGCESVKRGIVTEEFIHIIVTAYFNGMFEVVRHEMTKEAAIKYIRLLNRYHMKGFETVFDAAGV